MTAQQKDWRDTYFGGCVRQWPISSVYKDEHELGKHEEHVIYSSASIQNRRNRISGLFAILSKAPECSPTGQCSAASIDTVKRL